MSKAREWVATRFGLPGKMNSAEVKDLVGWLLKDGHFKYGEVDTQVRPSTLSFPFWCLLQNKTYNTKLPFGCEGIAHILRLEVLSTRGGTNIEIFREIVNVRKIAPTTIALMLTFVSLYFLVLLLSFFTNACRLSMDWVNMQKVYIDMLSSQILHDLGMFWWASS